MLDNIGKDYTYLPYTVYTYLSKDFWYNKQLDIPSILPIMFLNWMYFLEQLSIISLSLLTPASISLCHTASLLTAAQIALFFFQSFEDLFFAYVVFP